MSPARRTDRLHHTVTDEPACVQPDVYAENCHGRTERSWRERRFIREKYGRSRWPRQGGCRTPSGGVSVQYKAGISGVNDFVQPFERRRRRARHPRLPGEKACFVPGGPAAGHGKWRYLSTDASTGPIAWAIRPEPHWRDAVGAPSFCGTRSCVLSVTARPSGRITVAHIPLDEQPPGIRSLVAYRCDSGREPEACQDRGKRRAENGSVWCFYQWMVARG